MQCEQPILSAGGAQQLSADIDVRYPGLVLRQAALSVCTEMPAASALSARIASSIVKFTCCSVSYGHGVHGMRTWYCGHCQCAHMVPLDLDSCRVRHLACRGRVSPHALLLGCCYYFYMGGNGRHANACWQPMAGCGNPEYTYNAYMCDRYQFVAPEAAIIAATLWSLGVASFTMH
jgi:hypothetical protein